MNKTITLYTMSYNGYWEKYGEQWCSYINNLNTKPDEIIVVSDIPIDLSILNYKNVKNIISPVVSGRRMVSEYRNIATKAASCDWIVGADLDDIYRDIYLDNIPGDSDIHAFKFYDKESSILYFPDKNSLRERLNDVYSINLIPSHSAIKKYVFDKLKYEDNCHEDRIFFAMASQLNLNVSSDSEDSPPRFEYTGFHNDNKELHRVTEIYVKTIIDGYGPVYSFWFSDNMSDNRKESLNILSESCKTLCLLDFEGFYKYENPELPIHNGFKYLTDNHKSDYARAYMMYFYGGGYSDIKRNNFDWNPYFKSLFTSKYDAIGYSEQNEYGIAKFSNTPEMKQYFNTNYDKFIGNGHYIFKPKTYMAYRWITAIHDLMDQKYNYLENNPGKTTHILDPNYFKAMEGYAFEWNEVGGRIMHRLQYENNLENILHGMPYVNIEKYR